MPFIQVLLDCGRREITAIVDPRSGCPDWCAVVGRGLEVQPVTPANAGGITMRKLLLASAAMLGATSGIASAQAPVPATANMMMAPSQGMMALPWVQGPTANNNNNSYGQPSTYSGGAAFGKN